MLKRILGISLLVLLFSIGLLYLIGGGFGDRPNTSELTDASIQFAHRGMINHGEENTIAGINLARGCKYNGFEIDISATKDRHLILFHDENCKRLLGVDTPIAQLNFSDLKTLKQPKNATVHAGLVPLLANTFTQFNDSFYWYLDIKTPSKWLADSLISIIKTKGNAKRIVVANSDILFLSYLKWKEPEIQTVLEGFNIGKEFTYFVIPKKWKPDFYASFLDQVDNTHVEWLKKHNLLNRKIVYGVTEENVHQATNFGLEKVIIDAVLNDNITICK